MEIPRFARNDIIMVFNGGEEAEWLLAIPPPRPCPKKLPVIPIGAQKRGISNPYHKSNKENGHMMRNEESPNHYTFFMS
jgi:hypothetical protein